MGATPVLHRSLLLLTRWHCLPLALVLRSAVCPQRIDGCLRLAVARIPTIIMHAPNHTPFAYISLLIAHSRHLTLLALTATDVPVVVCGDFNNTPGVTLHSPKAILSTGVIFLTVFTPSITSPPIPFNVHRCACCDLWGLQQHARQPRVQVSDALPAGGQVERGPFEGVLRRHFALVGRVASHAQVLAREPSQVCVRAVHVCGVVLVFHPTATLPSCSLAPLSVDAWLPALQFRPNAKTIRWCRLSEA